MKKLLLLVTMLLLFVSCTNESGYPSGEKPNVTNPSALYTAITQQAELPEMFPLTEEELLYLVGIEPEWYTDAVAYTAVSGTSPDEILILRAVDADTADLLREALQSRLKYKQDSAKLYLTENQPILNTGVVRVDGLTVSLLVTGDMEAVLSVYP